MCCRSVRRIALGIAALQIFCLSTNYARASSPEEGSLDDFLRTLSSFWASVCARKPQEVLQSLMLTFGAHTLARNFAGVVRPVLDDLSHTAEFSHALPRREIQQAVHMAEAAYDPSFYERNQIKVSRGPLSTIIFDVLVLEPVAKVGKPAICVLRHRNDPVVWVTIRGTSSLDDVLTDLDTGNKPYLDGCVHSGVFSAAEYVYQCVRQAVGSYHDQIWLTGHSLGGGAAAIATGEYTLRSHARLLCVFIPCGWQGFGLALAC